MAVRVGITFPQTVIGTDVSILRDWAQAADGAGFKHMAIVDHVLGAHRDRFTRSLADLGLTAPPYTDQSEIHEVFTLCSYFAAITQQIEFSTSILILTQRQTAVVAKQAAELDLLSGGRLRLGIGVGWNYVEMEALGENFHNRGRRMEEQIELLRKLWTEPLVTFEGRWHHIDRLSINPLPVQRPIPLWIGCSWTEPLMRRVARMADGWIPRQVGQSGEDTKSLIERLHQYVREAGRDPADVGVEVRLSVDLDRPEGWLERSRELIDAGVTHLTLGMPRGAATPRELVDAVPRIKQVYEAEMGSLAG
jgi:probable F420-dependent oxidoreductase